MTALSPLELVRRSISAGALALIVLSFATPEALAQRGSTGPRVQRLSQPQSNLASLPPGTIVPRQAQLAAGQRPTIVLTGYWPPSNEALRRFSTDPVQNPAGWIGQNWEGRGYDVHSFFPEFTPPNCSNCGKGTGDLEVDYQDFTADFWPIVDALDPIAVITFSRGFNDFSWELEMNQYNRSVWVGDFLAPFQPTPAPPDAGWPSNGLRLSTHPVQAILDAINTSGLNTVGYICYSGDGGGFLSEFAAYHGAWYQGLNADPADPEWCVAGGHVHVGGMLDWPTAEEAAKVTLRAEIGYLDSVLQTPCAKPTTYCTAKTSSLGCVPAIEAVGFPSLSGGSFQVRATQLHGGVPGIMIWSHGQASIPFQNGTMCLAAPITRTDGQSTSAGPSCTGTLGFIFGPAYQQTQSFAAGQNMFAQFWTRDVGDPFGSSLSNALAFIWCP
jgi:hypothetical protein